MFDKHTNDHLLSVNRAHTAGSHLVCSIARYQNIASYLENTNTLLQNIERLHSSSRLYYKLKAVGDLRNGNNFVCVTRVELLAISTEHTVVGIGDGYLAWTHRTEHTCCVSGSIEKIFRGQESTNFCLKSASFVSINSTWYLAPKTTFVYVHNRNIFH